MILYHNHIPRTSGTFIQAPLSGLLTSRGVKYCLIYQADQIDDNLIKSSNHIFGHMGCYPNTLITDVTQYGIIRNPLDRFISTFKFFTKNIFYTEPTEKILEEWLYNPLYINAHSNLQSKFLTGYSDKDVWNINTRQSRVANGWFIKDSSTDLELIKNKINFGYWASMDNNGLLLDWLSDYHYKLYDFRLYNRRHRINESDQLPFEIPQSMINRIVELNDIDFSVYEYVKSTELKRFK